MSDGYNGNIYTYITYSINYFYSILYLEREQNV